MRNYFEDAMLIPLENAAHECCGGKAAVLAQLIKEGIAVPRGYCLPMSQYLDTLSRLDGWPYDFHLKQSPARTSSAAVSENPQSPTPARTSSAAVSENPQSPTPARTSSAAAKVHRLNENRKGLFENVTRALMTWTPEAALLRELEHLLSEFSPPLIIRSSASCEDHPQFPTSGIFSSIAQVQNLKEMITAIRLCWTSLWREPAWAILQRRGSWPADEAMAVIIQKQVSARLAGVFRSRDPQNNRFGRLEVVVGPNSLLADGLGDPDWLLLSRKKGDELPYHAALSKEVMGELRDMGLRIETLLQQTVDLEWVFDGEKLWIVQARPVHGTSQASSFSWSPPPFSPKQMTWYWDRAHNPTPLSWAHASLIEMLEEKNPWPHQTVQCGYLFYCEPPAESLYQHKCDDSNNRSIPTTCVAASRNTASITSPLRQGGGAPRGHRQSSYFDTNPEPASIPLPKTEHSALSSDLEELFKSFKDKTACAIQALQEFFEQPHSIEEKIERALTFFRGFYQDYRGDLHQERKKVRQQLVGFLQRFFGPAEPQLIARLSMEKNSSLERCQDLFEMAQLVAPGSALETHLKKHPWSMEMIPESPFRQRLKIHLERFGYFMSLWDVATPTIVERSELLMERLFSFAKTKRSPESMFKDALAEAERQIAQLVEKVPKSDRNQFLKLINQNKLARKIEEEDDILFSRSLAMVRQILLQAGTALSKEGRLKAAEDVFFMKIAETLSACKKPTFDLKAEIEDRKAAWKKAHTLIPPLQVKGTQLLFSLETDDRTVLKGLGVGGTARGRVCLVSSPDEAVSRSDLRDAVLVCPTLSPALAVVLSDVAALVTEHGGLLSHAACLAREMGTPAVVGVRRAGWTLSDGETVLVDGINGLVIRES